MADHQIVFSSLDDRPGSSSSSLSQSLSTTSATSASISIDTNMSNYFKQDSAPTSYSVPTSPVSSTQLSSPTSGARPKLKGKRGSTMNGPLYMQSGPNSRNMYLVRRRKDHKDEGMLKGLTRWFVENQIGLSFNLLALLFLTHMFIPKARPHTRKFFTMSYRNTETQRYGAGSEDAYLISFLIVLYTGVRAFTMEYLLTPLGRTWGITKRKTLTRFSEQAYMLLCYVVFWSLGMHIYKNSKYFLNMREMWTDWPDREVDSIMKVYMLVQLAFWLQQVIVLFIEEKRNDHWQMLSHHIITIGLISACYRYHFTRVGNLILVIMDPIDLIFPLAKCLKYTGQQTLCDIAFGIFIVTWFVTRHIIYPMASWSVYRHSVDMVTLKCFSGPAGNVSGPMDPPPGYGYLLEPFLKSDGLVCYSNFIMWLFLGPLLMLQGLLLIWFTMIIRVAARVLRGGSADDVRSDGEDEGVEDSEEFVYEEAAPLEEEVGVEALDLKGWERRAGVSVKRASSATGVSLPGHSDRKELLGRIGCDSRVE